MRDLFSLLDQIHVAYSRPEYSPGKGLTHCNQFVAEVALGCGFKGLEGLLANEIIELLAKHDQWSEIPLEKAQDAGNQGSLIVAGIPGNPHGHVCIVCPGKAKTSGRWGIVPTVANIGATNFIGGLNWAFSDMPKLWVWRPSL